jgi:hypothetical protein
MHVSERVRVPSRAGALAFVYVRPVCHSECLNLPLHLSCCVIVLCVLCVVACVCAVRLYPPVVFCVCVCGTDILKCFRDKNITSVVIFMRTNAFR